MAKKTVAKRKATKKSPTATTSAKKKTTSRKSSSSKKSKAKGRKTSKRALGIRSQHVDFLSYKVDQVRKFYEEMLGLPSETRDTEGLNYLVVTTSSSSSLGFMPPHPEMRSEQPLPREPTLYFLVDNLDAVYAKLLAKGVGLLGPPQEMPWGHRVLSTMDPEGRMIMFGEQPSRKS